MSYSAAEEEPVTSDVELYIVAVILLCFCLIGTGGNALVLYVFSKKKDGLVSTLFIMVLAVVDFMTCLVVIPFTIAMELMRFYVRYDAVCKIYQFLITSNIPFSALIMAAIAVDRYLCICHPFLRISTVERARLAIVVLGIFASALGLGGSLTHGVYLRQFVGNRTLNVSQFINKTTSQLEIFSPPGVDGSSVESKSTDPDDWVIEYTGTCNPTDVLISETFGLAFQKCYTGIFLGCLAVVSALYGFIYYSVHQRRTKRQQMKAKERQTASAPAEAPTSRPAVTVNLTVNVSPATELSCAQFPPHINGSETSTKADDQNGKGRSDVDSSRDANERGGSPNQLPVDPTKLTAETTQHNGVRTADASSSNNHAKETKETSRMVGSNRRSVNAPDNSLAAQARRNRIANVKTAAMLFVVTLTFIVLFVPALSMAVQLLPYNMTVFYMYFGNNVANPIIYSFMNKNFRKHLKGIFC